MYRIGLFSQLSGVPIRELRSYDQLGILKPNIVSNKTGFRYYSTKQLSTVQRIQVLRELGFRLEEIKELVDQNATLDQVEDLVFKKKRKIRMQLQILQNQIDELNQRIAKAKQMEKQC